ncbi:MAG: hypothetical protein V1798_03340, partial [Pseudomonadota bacterium]
LRQIGYRFRQLGHWIGHKNHTGAAIKMWRPKIAPALASQLELFKMGLRTFAKCGKLIKPIKPIKPIKAKKKKNPSTLFFLASAKFFIRKQDILGNVLNQSLKNAPSHYRPLKQARG